MAKSKATKKALLGSVVALLLCFTMLMGATFAWFTDNVSSTGNRIQAGDLEVDLVMDKLDGAGYVSIADGSGDIFSEATGNGINWEPGKTEIVYLGVRNNGSLALKYNIVLDIIDGGLIGSLEYAVLDGVKAGEIAETDWATLKARSDAQTGDIVAGQIVATQGGVLDEIALNNVANETDYFALAVHMKEEAGNEYENKSITIDVQVNATQKDAEDDSFGPDYDAEAWGPGFKVFTYEDLQAALSAGETNITLMDDITATDTIIIPAAASTMSLGSAPTYSMIINLNGNTLSTEDKNTIKNEGGIALITNGKVERTGSAIGYAVNNAAGSLTVDNATIVNGLYTSGEALTLNNSNVSHSQSSRHAIYSYNCETTINGGTYHNDNAGNATVMAAGSSVVTINDGTFSIADGMATLGWTSCLLDASNTASYVINNGTFKGGFRVQASANMTINGGTYADTFGSAYNIYGKATVKGGTFTDTAAKNFAKKYIADGYIDSENANGSLVVSKFVPTFDPAEGTSLYDAIKAMNPGDSLIIPGGTYITTGSFQVPADVTLIGAEGEEVIIEQQSAGQDNILACAGDVTLKNITFKSNRKGYAVADNTKNHDTDGDFVIENCKFIGIAAEKNYGVYKNLNGNLTVKNCSFDNYNNALCGISNGNGSTTTISGCTFKNINGEAIGYVTSTMPADFEATVIANNTGLTADNVIGY